MKKCTPDATQQAAEGKVQPLEVDADGMIGPPAGALPPGTPMTSLMFTVPAGVNAADVTAVPLPSGAFAGDRFFLCLQLHGCACVRVCVRACVAFVRSVNQVIAARATTEASKCIAFAILMPVVFPLFLFFFFPSGCAGTQ